MVLMGCDAELECFRYAAICAAPAVALAHHGLLDDTQATCYPTYAEKLTMTSRVTESIVIDQQCITGRSAAYTMDFSLGIVEILLGRPAAQKVADALLTKLQPLMIATYS